jgi:hypothetical protein
MTSTEQNHRACSGVEKERRRGLQLMSSCMGEAKIYLATADPVTSTIRMKGPGYD